MRHHRLSSLAWMIPLGLALTVASCDVTNPPGSFYVTYRVNLPGGIGTIDSLYYSPGTGKCVTTCSSDSTYVKVTRPALSSAGIYSQELTVPSGATLDAILFGNGVAAGTAQFTVIWMTATGTLAGDSVTTATAAATKFQLAITNRKI